MAYDPNWKWPVGTKHKGRTLAEIAAIDLQYLEWVATWDDEPRIRERVTFFLDHTGRTPRSSDGAASQTTVRTMRMTLGFDLDRKRQGWRGDSSADITTILSCVPALASRGRQK